MAATLPGANPPSPRTTENGGANTLADRVSKLRQVREWLHKVQDLDRCVSVVPAAPVRRWLYSRLGIEGARYLQPDTGIRTAPNAAPPKINPNAPRRLSFFGALLFSLVVAAALTALWFHEMYQTPTVAATFAPPPVEPKPELRPVAE